MITYLCVVKLIVCATMIALYRFDPVRARFSALYLFWYLLPALLIGKPDPSSLTLWYFALLAMWDLTIASSFRCQESSPLRKWLCAAFLYCAAINVGAALTGYTKCYFFFDNYFLLIQSGAVLELTVLILVPSRPTLYNRLESLRIMYREYTDAKRRRTSPS